MEIADFRLLKGIRYGMTETFSDIISLTYPSGGKFESAFQNLDSRLASAGVFEELRNSNPYAALHQAVSLSRTDPRAAGMLVHRHAGLMMTTLYALSRKIRPPISEAERTRVSNALKKYSMFLGDFYKDANSFGIVGGSGTADLWFSTFKRHHTRFYGLANEFRDATSGIGYELKMQAALNELELDEDEFGETKANIERVCKFPALAEKITPSIRSEYSIDDGWDETNEVSQLKGELSSAYDRIKKLGAQLDQMASQPTLKIVSKHEGTLERLGTLQKELSESIGLNRPVVDVSITVDKTVRALEKIILSETEDGLGGLDQSKRGLLIGYYKLMGALGGLKSDALLDGPHTELVKNNSLELLKFLKSKEPA
jgi:hypothetical protein